MAGPPAFELPFTLDSSILLVHKLFGRIVLISLEVMAAPHMGRRGTSIVGKKAIVQEGLHEVQNR